MTTFRRTTALAALVAAFLLAPGRTTAQQTSTFAALKSSYETATLEIAQPYVQREREAQMQYGKALDGLLAVLKQKGDLDGYLVVETEKKRLFAEGTVPNATNSVPVLSDAVRAYYKVVASAETERDRQTAALLKKYVAGLDGLIKQAMQADRIEDAKAVKVERDKAASELANLEAKQPPEPKTSDVEHKSPSKTETTPGQAGGGKTYSASLWITQASRWADVNIPPVKKGDKLLFRCEPRPLMDSKGKFTKDMFKIRIGASDQEFLFDSNGKYSRQCVAPYVGTIYYTPEPSLEVTAENDGKISVYRKDVANFRLVVTVQNAQADKTEEAKAAKAERDRVASGRADAESKLPEMKPVPAAESKPAKRQIPKDARIFRAHHYLFVAEVKPWREAKKACEEMGGHLVTISSKEENEVVYGLTKGKGIWIGCTDEEQEGEWKWMTGETFSFQNWCVDVSGSDSSNGVQDYGIIEGTRGSWKDSDDAYLTTGRIVGFVCEWER